MSTELYSERFSRRHIISKGWRLAVGGVAGAAVLGLLCACGASSSAQPTGAPAVSGSSGPSSRPAADKLRVQLSWIKNVEFAGLYAADSQGYLAAESVEQDLIAGGPDTDTVQAAASGLADIVLAGGAGDVVLARANGIPLRAFATQYQKSPECIMSLAESAIKSADDLRGKRIGVQESSRYDLEHIMQTHGIDKSEVTVITVGDDPTPLVTKQVDGFIAFAFNQPVALEMIGIGTYCASMSDLGGVTEYDTVYSALDSVIDAHHDALVRWLRGATRGWEYFIAHPAEMAAYAVQQGPTLDLDPKQQETEASMAIPFLQSEYTKTHGLLWIQDTVFEQTAQQLVASGKIKSAPAVTDVMTTSLLDAAHASTTSP